MPYCNIYWNWIFKHYLMNQAGCRGTLEAEARGLLQCGTNTGYIIQANLGFRVDWSQKGICLRALYMF